MSQIDQVLATARSLQLAGKTPSLALLKAKLKSIPMPVLVLGLQRFKALSVNELDAIEATFSPNQATENTPQVDSDELRVMRQQLKALQLAYNELALRVTKLERQD
ncbi:MAG: hypothetical protein LPD71_03150 [Shewanella sp.]|nr:hypothetical protein [Shewanella sp.]MCF1429318.1 hypothetical protein [Shewanella sp.]MCF1437766.1 hypothetical protein [Shewanella sp.]MCF1456534.1 hypothetical protein [Shewanella sp.]